MSGCLSSRGDDSYDGTFDISFWNWGDPMDIVFIVDTRNGTIFEDTFRLNTEKSEYYHIEMPHDRYNFDITYGGESLSFSLVITKDTPNQGYGVVFDEYGGSRHFYKNNDS